MPDTGKTTKAIREAPVAPESVFEEPYRDLYPETKPRYTVELTTEGWQIKDNAKGTIRADVYPSKREAEDVVRMFESVDEAEGQGRR